MATLWRYEYSDVLDPLSHAQVRQHGDGHRHVARRPSLFKATVERARVAVDGEIRREVPTWNHDAVSGLVRIPGVHTEEHVRGSQAVVWLARWRHLKVHGVNPAGLTFSGIHHGVQTGWLLQKIHDSFLEVSAEVSLAKRETMFTRTLYAKLVYVLFKRT